MMKTEEKEEGEISLEDVSSSDEGQTSYRVPWTNSVTSPIRRSHSLRDAGHGKENRRYLRDLRARYLPTLQSKSEGLLPISSEDEHEIVELPDSSHHLCIHLGKKKRKKRKRKKSSGSAPLSLDDFVSVTEPDPDILNAPTHTEITVHRRRSSPSPRSSHRHSPFTRIRDISRSPPSTPPRLFRTSSRLLPSPRPHHYSRSPSPQRRSPRRRSRSRSPRKSSAIVSKNIKKSPITSRDKSHFRHPSPDVYASFLLKKVRRLDETGGITFPRIHKDGTSLKDKLSNILNTKSVKNSVIKQLKEDKNGEELSEGGDDIEVLRHLALQTKQKTLDKSSEPDHLSDNDPEDLELRMIALKSAVIKKHEERVKKRKKRDNLRDTSPFGDNFFNDVVDNESSSDTRQVEDMELDTDVEREKECYSPYSPYSPSDEEMRDSPEINYPNVSSVTDVKSMNNCIDNEDERDMEAPYSPTDPTKTPWVDRFNKEKRKNILTTITIKSNSESSDEAPYSPSDTPMYDPELPSYPLDILDTQDEDNCTALDLSMKDGHKNENEIVENEETSGNIQGEKTSEAAGDTPEIVPEPLITRDNESQEINTDCPINFSKDSKIIMNIEDNSLKNIAEQTGEPFYLRGIPEVTKEPNKIPILVNRSLVPVSILKSNKSLQQRLPQKKIEISSERVFKSAEMLPVDVETEPIVSTSVFKPIKLQTVMKKSTIVASAAAFNNVSIDESNSLGSEAILKVVEDVNDKSSDQVSSDKSERTNNVLKKSLDSENSSETKNSSKQKRRKGGRKTLELRRKHHLDKKGSIRDSGDNYSRIRDQKNSEDSSKNSKSTTKSSERGKLSNRRSESIDKKSRSNEKENLSVIEVSRLEMSMRKVGEQNKDEESVQVESIVTGNDKKRRNSIEEDEETLRAILLASLAKRPKSGDIVGTRGSDGVSKASEGSSEVQKVEKVPEKDKGMIEGVRNIVETCQVVNKVSQEITDSPVSGKGSELINHVNNTSTPVQKSSTSVQQADKGVNAVEARKRLNTAVIRGPPKKIIRKIAIPVSTKVVNNAKKFQNIMVQRKLILQAQEKEINSGGGISKNLTLNNLKTNEISSSGSPKIKASGKVQRLVIKLGEDSDSDSGEDGAKGMEGSGGERAVLAIPTTDFEKSVDQFLKEQRKKQEIMAMSSTAVTSTPTCAGKGGLGGVKITDGLGGTPLAVRHLPPSQQEEYKRLKQKILEKERQRANRQMNTPPGPLSPASPISKSPKPSTLTKASNPPSQDPKTPPRILPIPKTQSKSPTIDSNLSQKSPQSEKLEKSGQMENLSIQIPNDQLTPASRLVIDKPENSDKNSTKVPTTLRILTTDQLNSKFTQVQLKLGERGVNLSDDKSLEDHDKSMGELLQSNGTIINYDITSINVNSDGNRTEINELSVDEIDNEKNQTDGSARVDSEASTVIIESQTNQSSFGDAGSSTVDSEASTVILPPRGEDNETDESSRDESGESTIVLDDTIEERRNIDLERSPTRAKSKSPIKENSERIKSDVRAALESLGLMSEEEQKKRLEEIERNLVVKRYSVLDDLTEMSSTLKQWDLERELQTNLFAEVRRLRAQLAIAEERLQEQRVKIDNIGPRVTKAHKTIVEGRTECLKLTKLCQGIGNKVVGQQYKVPVTGAQLMMERLKEVAYHTRQLSKKKVPCENSNNELGSSVGDEQSKERRMNSDSEVSWGDNVNSEAEQSDNATRVVISRLIERDPVIQDDPLSGAISGENSRPLSTLESSTAGGSMNKHSHFANSYESVLTSVRTPRHIDPNLELCPFELTGVCKDDGCLYNHLEPRSQPQTIRQ